MPKQLLTLIERIEGNKWYKIKSGSCRHITIDYHSNGFFRQEPAVVNSLAGRNIFILGLKSDCVMTLTPPIPAYEKFLKEHPRKYRLPISNLATLASTGRSKPYRTDVREVCLRSYSDADLDILSLQGCLLHFEGPARSTWGLSIRPGVEGMVDPYRGVCDWFGSTSSLLRRGAERIQVTLGFD